MSSPALSANLRRAFALFAPQQPCGHCGRVKPLGQFYHRQRGDLAIPDTHRCKACWPRGPRWAVELQARWAAKRIEKEEREKCRSAAIWVCPKCGNQGLQRDWPRYDNGKPTRLCRICDASWAIRRQEIPEGYKVCLACRGIKPEAEFHFYPGRAIRDGRCDPCRLAYKRDQERHQAEARGRSYRPIAEVKAQALRNQAERLADQVRAKWARKWLKPFDIPAPSSIERYAADPEYRKAMKEKSQRRYAADPNRERARVQFYRHAHPDRVAKWGDRRKQLAAAQSDGTLTCVVVGKLFAEAKQCPYCGCEFNRNKSLDHLVPLAEGGVHGVVNVLICCRDCNIRKHAKPVTEWLERLEPKARKRVETLYRKRYGASPRQRVFSLSYVQ